MYGPGMPEIIAQYIVKEHERHSVGTGPPSFDAIHLSIITESDKKHTHSTQTYICVYAYVYMEERRKRERERVSLQPWH